MQISLKKILSFLLNRPVVGTVICMNTPINPADVGYRGTWTLIDKEFTPLVITDSGVTWNNTNTQNSTGGTARSFAIRRSGHEFFVRFTWYNKVAISDTDQDICTIDGSVIGLASTAYTTYTIAVSDGLNALFNSKIAWSLSNDNKPIGTLTLTDYFQRSAPSSSTNHAIAVCASIFMTLGAMDDSSCNKFYYKRIA